MMVDEEKEEKEEKGDKSTSKSHSQESENYIQKRVSHSVVLDRKEDIGPKSCNSCNTEIIAETSNLMCAICKNIITLTALIQNHCQFRYMVIGAIL